MKYKNIFVILHYNEKSLSDTIECVDSIKNNLKNDFFKIIIVENGSGDRSAERLSEKYSQDNVVDLVISDKNLGFAKGNNLGCRHAIEKYNPDFLIVINNDTIIEQKDFLKKMNLKYEEIDFDMMGPFIYDRNLEPQNPVPGLKTNLSQVEKEIKNVIEELEYLEGKKLTIHRIKKKLKRLVKKNKTVENTARFLLNKKKTDNRDLCKDEIENIGLHGSAIIFSKKYFQKYIDVFYPKTFMFVEEDILYNRVLKDNLISIYYPEIEIYHKEDKSTEAVVGTNLEKKKFILNNVLDSLKIYKKILEEEN